MIHLKLDSFYCLLLKCPFELDQNTMLGINVKFDIETSNRDIPHHRVLLLEFENGKCLKIRFDQGVAYWRVRFSSYHDMRFDFGEAAKEQIIQMTSVVESAMVQNSEQKWATDVLIELL